MSQVSKIRVAVVFGGRSSEHAISCVTAGAVMAAIDRDRYEVLPIGIARDGRWVLASGDQRLAIQDGRLPEVSGEGSALALPFDPDGNPNVYTPREQTLISNIWSRVAEHYSMFNVDVTTERPLAFTWSTIRALVTKRVDATGITMPSHCTGGAAYVGVVGSVDLRCVDYCQFRAHL